MNGIELVLQGHLLACGCHAVASNAQNVQVV
jgi:hypothetical protein